MNIEFIKSEFEKLTLILRSWKEGQTISAIERDIVLEKLRNIYDTVRFESQPAADDDLPMVEAAPAPAPEPAAAPAPAAGDETENRQPAPDDDVEVEFIFSDDDDDIFTETDAGYTADTADAAAHSGRTDDGEAESRTAEDTDGIGAAEQAVHETATEIIAAASQPASASTAERIPASPVRPEPDTADSAAAAEEETLPLVAATARAATHTATEEYGAQDNEERPYAAYAADTAAPERREVLRDTTRPTEASAAPEAARAAYGDAPQPDETAPAHRSAETDDMRPDETAVSVQTDNTEDTAADAAESRAAEQPAAEGETPSRPMNSLFGSEEIKRSPRTKHHRMMSIYGDAEPVKQEKVVDISKIFDLDRDDDAAEPAPQRDGHRSHEADDYAAYPRQAERRTAAEPRTPLAADGEDNGGAVLGEVIASAPHTLADTLAQPSPLAEEITHRTVTSLRKAIGINDKFLMIRDLFGGDEQEYEKAVDALDRFDDLDDCMIYIVENYAWNPNSEGAKFMMRLLERKLS